MASTKRTLTYDIEFGLKGALNQLTHLRSILQDSVRPDSTSFRVLSSLIQKTQHNVEQLYATMNSSLETSAGAKKYSQDLLKLSDAISDIMVRMKAVRTGDILFSPEESQKLQDLNDKITQIQKQMTALKSLTISNLFSDNTASEEFKNLQNAAKILGVELDKVDASTMERKITDALDKIDGHIAKSKQEVSSYQERINKLKDIDAPEAYQKLAGAGNKYTTARIIRDESRQQKVTNEIKALNESTQKQLEGAGITEKLTQPGKNFFNSRSVQDAIDKQTDDIHQALIARQKTLEQDAANIEHVLERLQEVQKGANKRNVLGGLIGENGDKTFIEGLRAIPDVDLAEMLNRTGENKLDVQKQIIPLVRQQAQSHLQQINAIVAQLPEIEKEYNWQVEQIFKSAFSETQIITGKDNIKQFITAMLQQAQDFGIEGEGLNIFRMYLQENIQEGMEAQHVFNNVLNILRQSKQAINEEATKLVADEQQAVAEQQVLKNASESIENKKGNVNNDILELTNNLKLLTDQIKELNSIKKNNFDISVDGGGTGAPPGGGGNEPPNYHEGLGAAAGAASAAAESMRGAEKAVSSLGNLRTTITNWMGFYQVINMTRSAISSMKNHIQELDQVMTQIAVVTNMTQEDLWAQIGKYSEIARQYGVSIKGVYQVSQIFYQQGGIFLEKNLLISGI